MPVSQTLNAVVEWAENPVAELYSFRLHRNNLTTEDAENTEKDKREMNNSDEALILYCIKS
jgi:hypothetical protein